MYVYRYTYIKSYQCLGVYIYIYIHIYILPNELSWFQFRTGQTQITISTVPITVWNVSPGSCEQKYNMSEPQISI